jgi:hypothetical protein
MQIALALAPPVKLERDVPAEHDPMKAVPLGSVKVFGDVDGSLSLTVVDALAIGKDDEITRATFGEPNKPL